MADRNKTRDNQRQQGSANDMNRQQSQQGGTGRQPQQGGQGQGGRQQSQQGSNDRNRQMGDGNNR